MEAADMREVSARAIVAVTAAGRSRTTIKRHTAQFNAPITRPDASRTAVACIRIDLPDRCEQRGDSSPHPRPQQAAPRPEVGKESHIKEEARI